MRKKVSLSTRLMAIYLVLTLLAPPVQVFAGSTVVAVGSGNTSVTTAGNGVQVVNINTANGAGLSHNKFTDYNVAANGQVLNNATASTGQFSQSQLAGLVAVNGNLTASAKAILLEVVAPNRSRLEGFTEVLGGKANVIVANPYGITCAGCGFINTDRASLITGTPNFNANGSLGAFSVNGGDILITGTGLNASAQQMLDLVSRSVKIDGQINVPDLAIVSGANKWDYDTRAITGAATASGTAPVYAIDSTVLGGIYAGRISLLATETGVGVRMLGEAASTANDFAINAAGKIEIANRLLAAGNLNLTTTAADADAIKLTDAALSAAGNLKLSAVNGGAAISGGVLAAQSDLAISAATLADTSTAATLTDNNKRHAGGKTTITTSGATTLSGVSYSSVGDLNLTATTEGPELIKLTDTSLASAGALNIAAAFGGVALSGGVLTAQTTLGINAGSLTDNPTAATLVDNNKRYAGGLVDVTTAGTTTLSGVSYSSGGNLNLTSLTADPEALKLTDARLSAATNLNLSAVNGGVTLVGGELVAKADLAITAQSLNDSTTATVLADNNARHAGGKVSIVTTNGQLAMDGVSYDAVGNLELNASAIEMDAIKLTDASLAAIGNLKLSALTSGTAISGGLLMTQADLGIAAQSFRDSATTKTVLDNNKRTASGSVTISASGPVALSGVSYGSVGDFNLTTTSAGIDAITLTDTSVTTTGMMSNLNISAPNGDTTLAGGALVTGADLGIVTGKLNDSSTATILADNNKRFANGAINISALGAASLNGASYMAGGSLSGSFASLATGGNGAAFTSGTTLGLMAMAGDLGLGSAAIHTTSYLNLTSDTGKITVSNGAGQGIQTSGGVLSIIAETGLENAGTMTADIGGAQISVNGLISNSGTINAGSYLTMGDKFGGNAVDIDLGVNGKLVGDSVNIKAQALTLASGSSIGGNSMNIAVNDLTLADASAKIIAAKTASSTGTPTILVANNFSNSGTIQSAGSLAIAAQSLTNNSSGTFAAEDTLKLFAMNTTTGAITGDITNQGKMYAGKELSALKMNNFTNAATPEAKVHSGDRIILAAANAINNNGEIVGAYVNFAAPTVTLGGNSVLASTGSLDMQADNLTLVDATAKMMAVSSGTGSAAINVTNAYTNNGFMYSGGDLRVTAPSIINSAGGTIAAQQALYLDPADQAATVNVTNAGVLYGGSLMYLTKVNDFTNAGTVTGGAITLHTAGTVTNNNVLLGSSVDIVAPQVSLGSASKLGSTGNMDIHATGATNGLTLAGDTAKIIAASDKSSTATITVDSAYTNNGMVHSDGNLTFTAPAITNAAAGTFSADKTLTLDAKGGDIYNAGSLYAGIKLDATAGSSFVGALPTATNTTLFTNAVGATIKSAGNISITATDFVNNSDKFLGESVDIIASKVTLGSGSRLESTGNMNIHATGPSNGLALAGATSKIIAASSGTGTATITADSVIHNPGLIFSGGDLSVTASSIVNDASGAFSALNDLTLNGGFGDILNSGTLYAGNQLTATAGSNIKNIGTLAAKGGEIISDGNLNLTTYNFTNNSLVNAAKDITIDAALFTNSVAGGDTRVWAETGRVMQNEFTSAGNSMIYGVGGCPPYTWDTDHCQRYIRDEMVTRTQSYTGGTPTFKPQIVGAAGTVTIKGFDTASNVGAIISGDNVTLTGKNTSSTFTNTDLTLNTYTYIDHFDRLYVFPVTPLNYHPTDYFLYPYIDGFTDPHDPVPSPTVFSPIDSSKIISSVVHANGTLTASGFILINNGSTSTPLDKNATATTTAADPKPDSGTAPTVTTPSAGSIAGGATVTGTAPSVKAPDVNAVTFGGLTLSLPTNPNGYFVINSDPTSRYLVVTNPLYAPAAQTAATVQGAVDKSSATSFKSETNPLYTTVQVYGTPDEPADDAASVVTPVVKPPVAPSGIKVPAIPAVAGAPVIPAPAATAVVPPAVTTPVAPAAPVGSEYLESLINYTTDKAQKYLGDASYETYLVRQQLVSLTNTTLLKGYDNQASQMKGLLNQAAAQSSTLALTYGQALSATQQAALTSDMVWMVETTVRGQKVLAPVVYLSKATIAEIETGAVISGGKVDMNLTSLTNTGGTISADKLNVTTIGDIKNSSGTIKGGDVKLTSTGGSIINETLVSTTGSDKIMSTAIGKTGGIIATNDLTVDAAKDITNKGAKMAAGGDASLSAGGNVTFDTVENKKASTSKITDGTKTVKTTDQIKSELDAGGTLTIKSKNDITLAGTDVTAGKSASLDAGGDVNILARNNTKEEITNTEKEGWGVAGGLYGKEKSDVDHYTSTNNGSTITVGKGAAGTLDITAGKTVTVKGSELAAKDMSFTAEEVKVLAGENIDRTTTKTEKTSWLSTSGGSDAVNATKSGATAASENTSSTGTAKSAAVASASADASVSKDFGGLDFKKTITNETTDETKSSVASKLNASGNIKMNTKKDITIQGSDVKAGGNVDLTAENVNIMAAENSHTVTSKSETTKVGLYAKSTNSAGATADAKAGAAVGIDGVGASAGVSAAASATAKTSNSIDFVRNDKTDTDRTDITHTGSTITSGGNLNINAKSALTVQGSDLSAEKDVTLKAKDMSFVAAEDTTYSKTTSTSTSVGLYVDGTAKANASAKAGASANAGAEAGGKASANASAELGIGVQVDSKTKTNIDGSSTARTSSIKSGSGSISRTADNTITDVGTNIEAAGDFSQSAKTIDMQAAKNTSYSSETTANTNVKVGVYAKAEAGASAEARGETGLVTSLGSDKNAQARVDVTAKVGAGISVNVSNDNSKTDSASSTAVVSTIKVGGKVSSTSSDKTTLEGTKITSGKQTEITADSLEFKAAQDTTSSSSTSNKTGVSAKIGVSQGTGSGIDASLDVAVGDKNSTSNSSTAVTGSITSGGDLVIKTRKDASFEGTKLDSGGDASIKSTEGSLTFSAAKNTASSTSNGIDVGVNASLARPTGSSTTDSTTSAGAAVDYKRASSSSSDAVVGSITSKGKMDISAKENATFEGTALESGLNKDINISAGGNVEMKAAKSTASSDSFGMNVGVKGSAEKDIKSNGTTTDSKYGQVGGGASTGTADSSTATVGSAKSGGNLNISSGKDSTFEGTALSSNNKISVDAGGSANFKAAENTDTSSGFGLSATVAHQNTTKSPTSSAPATGTGTAPAGTDTINRNDTGVGAGVKIISNDKSTHQGATLDAKNGIEIKAGKGDVNLESTKLSNTEGDIKIKAAGKVNETTVTDKNFGINLDVPVPVITVRSRATKTPATKGTGDKVKTDDKAKPVDKTKADDKTKATADKAKPDDKTKAAADKAKPDDKTKVAADKTKPDDKTKAAADKTKAGADKTKPDDKTKAGDKTASDPLAGLKSSDTKAIKQMVKDEMKQEKKAEEKAEKALLFDTNILRTGEIDPRITAPSAISDPNKKAVYTNDKDKIMPTGTTYGATGGRVIKEEQVSPPSNGQ